MFAVVDLETTGGHAGTDKIIEIAIYIHDGNQIVDEYSSLVNPGVDIPYFISKLTGITDDMVSSAPSFSDIANDIAAILSNHVFVAHNVMFDYQFISFALKQNGYNYERKLLCTCRTSRTLLPGLPSYSLGKLCRSLSIPLNDAHRAAADAKATTYILDLLLAKSKGGLEPFYSRQQKLENKSRIPNEQIEKLPSKAGVLYFYDEQNTVIYVAQANNIRKKSLSILSKIDTKRFSGIAAFAVSVDYVATGGTLLAAILEIEAIRKLSPRYNRVFKAIESRFSIYDSLNKNGYLVLKTGIYQNSEKPLVTFSSEKEAKEKLAATLSEFELQSANELHTAHEKLFSEPVENYNERAHLAIEAIIKQRKNYLITDRGPEIISYRWW
ncbi:MAG: DNA polymerase III subunit epsilon [Bacteroidetes bacterium]|nr:DNA polymerase III subunit epsilon [Bacteroidota bacterium]